MRKKFLYLLLSAILGTILSLLYFRGGNYCPMSIDSDCQMWPAMRGFPLPILFLGNLGLLELSKVIMQIFGFVSDLLFYFVIFSAIYFVYLKVFKKVKKK